MGDGEPRAAVMATAECGVPAAVMAAAEAMAAAAETAAAECVVPAAVVATAEMHTTEAMTSAAEMAVASAAEMPTSVTCTSVTASVTSASVTSASVTSASVTSASVTSASASFPQRRTRQPGHDNQNGNSNEGLRHGILAAPSLIASQMTRGETESSSPGPVRARLQIAGLLSHLQHF
jgi:hypothetical protein